MHFGALLSKEMVSMCRCWPEGGGGEGTMSAREAILGDGSFKVKFEVMGIQARAHANLFL